ncbi:MAG: hypothetical protein D6675_15170 [Gemmatimonadetes bacterium]|nr:MAG: hypothetical protein D6675_15170 [Gemmatimonadota bacterium]
MEEMLLEEAVKVYNDLVSQHKESAQEINEIMSKRMRESKLSYGDRLICAYLRPKFVTRGQLTLIKNVNVVLQRALIKLKEALFKVPGLYDEIGLTEAEARLTDIYPGYDRLSITSRWDSFFTAVSLKFVELNAEAPAGIAYSDRMTSVMMENPIIKEFSKKYIVYRFGTSGSLLAALLHGYYDFLRNVDTKKMSSLPRIAIVDWRDVPTWTEFELFEEFFESQGFKTVLCDPRELEYTNGRLRYKGLGIDLVYRRLLTNELLAKIDELQPLIQAYKDHAVCVINSFRAKLIHKKSLFALLTDERFQRIFSDEERFVIHTHVPWTRRIQERKTVFAGRQIDLIPFIREHKNSLVIKPNDEYGGKGVTLGWNVDQTTWDHVIKTALNGEYFVVQERTPIPVEEFPRFENNQLTFEELIVDFDPYTFEDEVSGILTRLSGASGLSNVTAGGGAVPTFVIEDR